MRCFIAWPSQELQLNFLTPQERAISSAFGLNQRLTPEKRIPKAASKKQRGKLEMPSHDLLPNPGKSLKV